MLNFPEPPKSYASVFLEDTDKPLPERIDPRTRYAMFSTIAAGGKSLIKSCKDLHLSRFVCYKTLKPEFAEDELEQRRLIREARVSAMLQHPGTVPTYELGRDARGNPYFTMKLVHGYTFREILDYRERYDLAQLVGVLAQVAQALDYAHTHGVVHRDVKPANILAGPHGEVLLLDWGLAKVRHPDGAPAEDPAGEAAGGEGDPALTEAGRVQGTAYYMSPEQINRDPAIDARADVFSLGAVLYEALCGEPPARGEKMHQVVASALGETPRPPSEAAGPKAPALLEETAMRCLEKRPEARVQTMAELARTLGRDWRAEPARRTDRRGGGRRGRE